jgi:hypothetical protein
VNTDSEMYEFYIEEGLPCLVDLREQYDVVYVIFADANVEDEFRKYDW